MRQNLLWNAERASTRVHEPPATRGRGVPDSPPWRGAGGQTPRHRFRWAVLALALAGIAQLQLQAAKVQGIVRRPDGKPAAGLPVMLVGNFSQSTTKNQTDEQGRFEVEWNPQQLGRSDVTLCLLIRDPEHNLAVAEDLGEDSALLELQLAPGLTLAGSAECEGKPLTNVNAALVFWTGNTGMHLPGLAVGTNTPGRFEIPALPPGRRYGVVISAPGHGQQSLYEPGAFTEAGRHEFRAVELKPARLKLAGKVVDAEDQPVTSANVSIQGEGQPSANTRTDAEGRFQFDRVCEGAVRLFASARTSHGNLTAEGGDTNVVLKLGESYTAYSGGKAHKLKGVVSDPDGKPAAGAQLSVFPSSGARVIKSGADGSYNLTWSLEPWQVQQGGSALLVIRDLARNLAAAEELEEEATNLSVRLKPSVTLSGRVEDADGKPLPGAEVGVWLLAARTYSQLDEKLVTTDAQGRFALKTLPPGLQYLVYAKARDRGRNQQQVDTDSDSTQVELEPFVLMVADQVIAGQVLDAKDKPVSGIDVSLSGDGQPEGSANTDKQGRFTFKVCEGSVQLFASGQSGYANTSAESGDTNVVLQLGRNDGSSDSVPRRASLKGKLLPDLTPLGLAAGSVPAGKPVLLCVLDIEQRPSRRMAKLLAEQHDALQQKGLTVLAAQAEDVTAESLKAWQSTHPVAFPVGHVAEKTPKTAWATSLEGFPWLILTDKSGRVVAEGFAWEELPEKLEAAVK